MGFKFVYNLLGYRFEIFGKSVLILFLFGMLNETNLKVCYLGVFIFILFISIVLCSGCFESSALLSEL